MEERIAKWIVADSSTLQVAVSDYRSFRDRVETGAAPEQLLALLEAWTLEPTALRFGRMADSARFLAGRLGKAPIDVVIDHRDVGLPSRDWSAPGRLTLRSRADNGSVIIEIEDDGHGVSWSTVRAAALASGRPAGCREDLVAALLALGVTTRSEVTETSGRGIGMAAVLEACQAMGGRVEVESDEGSGTLVRLIAPEAWTLGAAAANSGIPSGSLPAPDFGAGAASGAPRAAVNER
jgi:two-component system chemotaxis sensor kinase CheA